MATIQVRNKVCIICRREKSNFSDEHVIPDSIQGYYHIDSVCSDCNQRMGSKIDHTLTNHQFIEFHRFLHGIKGKSGAIPNPFSGTYTLTDDPTQKVQLSLDKEGKIIPKLIPKIKSELKNGLGAFSLTVDMEDISMKDEILEKFYKRNGINKDNVKSEMHIKSGQPSIDITFKVDIHKFKLGLLKIAYEFAVDQIPKYFEDDNAKKIAKALFYADFDKLNKIEMLGDGLTKEILLPFSHLLEFDEKSHYLILFDTPDYGLLCIINLYNIFTMGFIMTKRTGFINDFLIVGKNDIQRKEFIIMDISKLVLHTFTPSRTRFEYFVPLADMKSFVDNVNNPNSGFYQENGQVPFFDSTGKIKYSNIDLKLNQKHLKTINKGDDKDSLITQVLFDEVLFIKLIPNNKLYRVLSAHVERFRIGKL